MTYLSCDYVLADIQLNIWHIYTYRRSLQTQTKQRTSGTSCRPRSRPSVSVFIPWRGLQPCPNLRLKSMDAHRYKQLRMFYIRHLLYGIISISSRNLLFSMHMNRHWTQYWCNHEINDENRWLDTTSFLYLKMHYMLKTCFVIFI